MFCRQKDHLLPSSLCLFHVSILAVIQKKHELSFAEWSSCFLCFLFAAVQMISPGVGKDVLYKEIKVDDGAYNERCHDGKNREKSPLYLFLDFFVLKRLVLEHLRIILMLVLMMVMMGVMVVSLFLGLRIAFFGCHIMIILHFFFDVMMFCC